MTSDYTLEDGIDLHFQFVSTLNLSTTDSMIIDLQFILVISSSHFFSSYGFNFRFSSSAFLCNNVKY